MADKEKNNDSTDRGRIPVKKILRRFMLIAVLLIPTVAALVSFYITANDIGFTSDDVYEISLYDSDGNPVASEKSAPAYSSSGSLVNIFHTMLGRLTPAESLPISAQDGTAMHAVVKYHGNVTEYDCYFSFTENSSYIKSSSGSVFKIDDRDNINFLSSSFSRSLYKTARPAKLYSTSGDVIIPSSVTWSYKSVDGTFVGVPDSETSSETLIYDMAGALGLKFDFEPDVCEVSVYADDSRIYSGGYPGVANITFDTGTVLHIDAEATWEHNENRDYYGIQTYSFDVYVSERSEFTVNGSEFAAGSFCVITCTNISDVSKIYFRCEPHIDATPIFGVLDGNAYALLPFPSDISRGIYNITLTYGASEQTVSLTVTDPATKAEVVSNATEDYIASVLGNNATGEYNSLLKYSSGSFTDRILFSGAFADYSAIGGTLIASFGDRYRFEETGAAYASDADDFSLGTQSRVTALNSGLVISTGKSEYLGNYVIVSHGLGLCTWYAHLDSYSVSKGDYVLKGQGIGIAGYIGFADTDGVTLICTIAGVRIDPSFVRGKEIPLKR